MGCSRRSIPTRRRQLGLFRAVSSEAGSVVGEIRGSHERTPLARLGPLARPLIERHRRSLVLAAIARLDGARDQARLVEGIDQVWTAAIEDRIGLLCVEEGFTQPAQVVAGGRRLVPATDVEHPDVLDDTIDEVIGLVCAAGGETVLVEDGALASRRRVAAVLCE